MKLFLLTLCVLAAFPLWAQDKEYPVATATDQEGVVISPYNPARRLDVVGLEPGSLAQDPIAKKIFRIPDPNPAKNSNKIQFEKPKTQGSGTRSNSDGFNEPVPPPPIDSERSRIVHSVPDPGPRDTNANSELPTDLLGFIQAFNQNSVVNDPNALLPFFADLVEDYFGEKKVNKAKIRTDRESYIKRYPYREYLLDGAPVLLAQRGNIYEVEARIRYSVKGDEKIRTGTVSDYFKIQRTAQRFEILSLNESKISSITSDITKPVASPSALHPFTQDTVYSRFQLEQIGLFLDAFAASGETNDPSSMIDFLHPQISSYYGTPMPDRAALLRDRQDYIKRWPNRRFWLTEKPVITPRSNGEWDIESKMGFEVKNNGKTASGVSATSMRLIQTSLGLKISSIKTL